MFLVTYDTAFRDRQTNPILIKMFDVINNRRKNVLHQIYPVSARPADYVHCVKHHIIPKSWFYKTGWPLDNTEYNTVNLTVIEHLKVHMLLKEYYEQKNDIRMAEAMAGAVSCIFGQNKKDQTVISYAQLEDPNVKETIDWIYDRKAKTLSEHYSDTRYVNNGEIQLRIKKDKPLPEGFSEGYLPLFAHVKWVHKDECELRIRPNDPIPFGYVEGRSPSKINQLKSNAPTWGDHVRGMKWYNNGNIQVKLSQADEIPEGFIKGRLPDNKRFITNGKQNKKIGFDEQIPDGWREGQSTKGTICVNDGKKTVRVPSDKIPKGFKPGRMGSNVKDRVAVSNDATHHYKMIQKSELEHYLANGYVLGSHIKQWLAAGYKRMPGYRNKGRFIKKQ